MSDKDMPNTIWAYDGEYTDMEPLPYHNPNLIKYTRTDTGENP